VRGDFRPGRRFESSETNYLANVSDLIAALVFVFIIMLVALAQRLSQTTEDLKAQGEARRQILQDIAEQLQSADLTVEVLADQGVLRLSENAINFPSGSATPAAEHRDNVGRLAHALSLVAPCYASEVGPVAASEEAPDNCHRPTRPANYHCASGNFPWRLETLMIEGHTDAVPVAAGQRFHDNLELSSMRAAKVHRMVTACEPGLDGLHNRAGLPILSTSGYGDTRPATADPTRLAANRRIDLRLLLEPTEEAVATERDNRVGEELRQRYRGG